MVDIFFFGSPPIHSLGSCPVSHLLRKAVDAMRLLSLDDSILSQFLTFGVPAQASISRAYESVPVVEFVSVVGLMTVFVAVLIVL